MLILFMLLKNAGHLKIIIRDELSNQEQTLEPTDPNYNLLTDRGILLVLYLAGLLLSTLIFYTSLK
jgi:hypothetical protein